MFAAVSPSLAPSPGTPEARKAAAKREREREIALEIGDLRYSVIRAKAIIYIGYVCM